MYNSRPMPTHYFSSATSRREFLRRAGLAAGALATSKLHSQTKAPRKLGIALLGLGRYSSNQLGPALRETEKCYLAGVVTGHREKGDRWAADYNLNKSNVYSLRNCLQSFSNFLCGWLECVIVNWDSFGNALHSIDHVTYFAFIAHRSDYRML